MPRAFEYVQQGDELCRQQGLGDAERAFQRGIRAYEKEKDTDGLAFALGRMGACYEQRGEVAKAIDVYRRAVNLKTDIPASTAWPCPSRRVGRGPLPIGILENAVVEGGVDARLPKYLQ